MFLFNRRKIILPAHYIYGHHRTRFRMDMGSDWPVIS